MNIPLPIREALRDSLGIYITEAHSLGGGCIHNAREVVAGSEKFFLKFNQSHHLSNFEAEAKGLDLLRSSEEVTVPQVIGHGNAGSYAWLILEFVNQGIRNAQYWEKLGWQIAGLHRHTAPVFGLDFDNYIGTLPQQNHPHTKWLDFFIAERIRPMLHLAVNQRELGRSTAGYFELLFSRLRDFFPEEPPALLHGDLWGGNILAAETGFPVLIDPAVYYGHREAELAFMTLFDAIPQRFFDAYEEVYPLSSGYRDRFDLYNLYPLLVHVNLFGGGYVTSVENILRRYV